MTGAVRYSGTKELLATPMTRGEYNAYRAWASPQGEDQEVAGYLVEYMDGGKPNDPRHVGYISWSPADVFEKAYRPAATFADRMRIELADLNDKLTRLQVFIGTERFNSLPNEERGDQREQLAAMRAYSQVLTARLVRATR